MDATQDSPATQPEHVTEAQAEADVQTGLLRQVRQIGQALRQSAVRRTLAWLAAGITLVIALTAYGQLQLNEWNKPFYDAISRRDLGDFRHELLVFLVIALGLLVLNVAQRWLGETLKWRLRESLVEDLTAQWMRPRRAFWLTQSGPMGVNPDQRMHDDTRNLCELSANLAIGLLQATVLFGSFAGVLWTISAAFSIHIGGQDYAVPGYMLWAAILYSGTGGVLSYFVGRRLVSRNAERYAREADLRYSLVRINEHLDGISLAAGEADEQRRIRIDLHEVLEATRLVVLSLTNLTWVTATFGWITNIFPVLVAAPLYFSGKLSFGGLIMAAAAFTQAEVSLRWFVDNYSVIADWRATLLRVASFRQALTDAELTPESGADIHFTPGPAGVLHIDGLNVEASAGHVRFADAGIEIHSGERVQATGAPDALCGPLFRALAGLWPWGSGHITQPGGERFTYLPRGLPYLPRGALRDVLAYPQQAGDFATTRYADSLQRFHLPRLVPLLDTTRRWDRELNHDEQIAVALARIFVQQPQWLLIDGVLATLKPEALAPFALALQGELSATGVIHIGAVPGPCKALFTRTLPLAWTPPPTPDPHAPPAGEAP
ncbi:MAG: ABC transporter ATP-binding protein/permease [Nevskiaceae bacterium]|nr:MAG: ABC transporter ATP-binding protein/permease [Nevskiaceae bacterium]TBR74590.1 MAG: ABC transporter ATP-binding protein/permease [Nevskiaceae bacterium]